MLERLSINPTMQPYCKAVHVPRPLVEPGMHLFQTIRLFRIYEILFRNYEIIFRKNEIIFRNNEIVFRKNKILFRKNEILFRKNEITREICILKKKVEHVTLGVP